MKGIKGNKIAAIQISTYKTNSIGEKVHVWETIQMITGWLDLASGEARYTTYNAKILESTHMFVADYVELDSRIGAENARMVINNKMYDITLIDNPMELNVQLEFYLKYTGGQDGQ